MKKRVVPLLCFFLLFVGPAEGADSDFDYGVRASVGHDGNPLRITRDGPNGVFTELRLDAGYRATLSHRLALFLEGAATQRLYESDTSNADVGRGILRAGVVISPDRWGRGRLAIAAGGIYSVRRSTFTDRSTGEVYRVEDISNPSSTVSIPDRYDSDTAGAFLDARWKLNSRVRLSLQTALERIDYVEDYTVSTDLEPLDYRSFTIEPGVSLRPSRWIRLDAGLAFTDLDYEDRAALNVLGQEMVDETREYHTSAIRFGVRFVPADRWGLGFGLRGSELNDTVAGYHDRTAWTSYVSVKRELGARSEVRLHASVRELDYDKATVTGNPGDPTRGSELRRFVADFDRRVHGNLRWFLQGGIQRTENPDPIFRYDREWFSTGVQFRR